MREQLRTLGHLEMARSEQRMQAIESAQKRRRKDELLDLLVVAGFTLSQVLREPASVPENVQQAFALAYPDLAQTETFSDAVARMSSDELVGLVSGVKGKLFELELVDHLWPWSREGWASRRALQVAGFSLAVAASVAWVMAAMGSLSSGAIIGWWFGWSVYEVLIRLSGKRYVKDGPWWRDQYRVAGVMDMLSYVGFKNLLIGAALFLAIKTLVGLA